MGYRSATSGQNSTSQANPYAGQALLPGTALAVAVQEAQMRMFYQNGDGDVRWTSCVLGLRGSNCGMSTSLASLSAGGDIKMFTPLASAGPLDSVCSTGLL